MMTPHGDQMNMTDVIIHVEKYGSRMGPLNRRYPKHGLQHDCNTMDHFNRHMHGSCHCHLIVDHYGDALDARFHL